MLQTTYKIQSQNPMLMHSDKLADPLNAATKQLKSMTDDRVFKATDDGKIAIAKHKYIHSLYLDNEDKIVLPAMNIRASLIGGARLSRGGKEVERGVIFLDDYLPLKYDGPDTVEELWEDSRFVDVRSVVVSRQRIMAYRPKFDDWSVEGTIVFDESIIDFARLEKYFTDAGNFCGVGDFRPLFGRYTVDFVA